MKKLSKIAFVTLIVSSFMSLTFLSCNKKESGNGTLEFSLKTQLIETEESLTKEGNVPAKVASFYIRIIDAVTEEVVYEEKRNLIITGSLSIEPIVLKVGSYKITDFVLYDASNVVLFILPKDGSEFAEIVNDSAPICIDITKDNSTQITIEVIGTNCIVCDIEDFGYISIDVVCPDCICTNVGTFALSDVTNHFELTDAQLLVYGISDCCEDLLETFNLTDIFNQITYGGSGEYYAYKFVFKKEGYTDSEHTFTVQELEHFAKVEPLSVILDNSQMLNDLYLISGFPFNTDLFGYGSNHYEATIIGTPAPTLINNTLRFSNQNSYLSLPSEILNGLNDFTMKSTISIEDNAANFIVSTNHLYFDVWLTSGNRIYVRLGSQEKCLTAPENFVFGQFYDIIVTRSGGEVTIYLDDTKLGVLTYTFEDALDVNQIRIGRRADNNHFYNGAIDDISFYNQVVVP